VDYHYALLALVLFLGLLYFGVQILFYFYERIRLRRIDAMAFPSSYQKIIAKIPTYKKLSTKQQEKMKRLILRFVLTKDFLGAKGLDVTREMKVVIAYYASLLVLNLPRYDSYRTLKQIIIYPHTIIQHEVQSYGGIYTQERFLLEGMSADDTVIISWHDAKKQAYQLHHNNLLIHEFAHEVDFMQGGANGVPPLQEGSYSAFVEALSKTYKRLCKKANTNRYWKKYKLLGAYAATNEAEFFAVATERFFESPKALKSKFPDLYVQLEKFYGIDMAS
jgi:MtfA peptidase